jgi:hypothetical protein
MRHRLCGRRPLRVLVALVLIVPQLAAAQARSADTVRIDVDGHAMQLLVSGTGGPAVVLEAGHSATSRTWNGIRDRLAAFTRVVAYDRPGLGGSAMCARPRDARTIALELRAALQVAGVEPPFLLVGWSRTLPSGKARTSRGIRAARCGRLHQRSPRAGRPEG